MNPQLDRGEESNEQEIISSSSQIPLATFLDIVSLDHNYCLRTELSGLALEPIFRTHSENEVSKNLHTSSFTKQVFCTFNVFIFVHFTAVDVATGIREKYKPKQTKYCQVPSCKNNSRDQPGLRFFQISKSLVLREMFNIRLETAYPKLKITYRYAKVFVCQDHYYVS